VYLVGSTIERARSRLSIDSIRSLAKRVMAKSRAWAISRLVRSWRFRKSATERRYLSYRRRRLERLVERRRWCYTFRSIISRFWASTSSFMGSFASEVGAV
jgi:hypothetical protein